ncbi:hypothetical protein [Actinomyces ruminicola]|uniref:CRISPR-associated protein n=1 Tax=Actinomyces ruminicola TaxID=332524 RepID=A0A1G9RLV1_9ACTO|nr:hypothetical protein [Actinomyces ruminicola]SDM24236.1 CRISPR-associated protein [Actinomyces ruminicola]
MADNVSFSPFHSAVNRIPVLRDEAQKLASQGRLPAELFDDFAPIAHDHLHGDRFSGSIDIKMIVRTPLVFGEQTKTRENGRDRHFVQVPTENGELGEPIVVPPTMVKGMISRAYETLTCSRFRVFGDAENRSSRRRVVDDHRSRLTYRGDPASALKLIPVRLTERHDDGSFTAELLQGDTLVKNDYSEGRTVYPTMMAASLQTGHWGHAKLVLAGGLNRLNAITKHGQEIHCHMSLCLHGDRGRGAKYAYWQVTHIRNKQGEFEEAFRISDSVTTIEDRDNVHGYVYRSTADGDTPDQLFARKHDERVFFDVTDGGPMKATVPAPVCEAYRIIVESYVAERESEIALGVPEAKRHRPNRPTKAAQEELEVRERARKDAHDAPEDASTGQAPGDATPLVELKADSLAYAIVDESDGHSTVEELMPVLIGRRAYETSPWDLADAQQVRPLSTQEEASAADRLFGYVAPNANPNAVSGDVASRGWVSFGPVDASRARLSTQRQVLSPLLGAKLNSGRRFLTDGSGKTPRHSDGTPLARREYYAPGQLLGAATYPIHRSLLGRPGFPKSATELPPTDGVQQDNIGVRLTALSWIQTGSELTCTLSFSNLSRVELSALLWVLTPQNLVPSEEIAASDDPEPTGCLRMGLGKPLGLGAIEVSIVEDGLRIVDNKSLAAAYEDLSACAGTAEQVTNPSELSFSDGVDRELRRQAWVKAMQRAAFGYGGNAPVRYMTLKENKANNQTAFKSGTPKPGYGIAPADLQRRANPIRVPKADTKHSGRRPRPHRW